MRDTDNRLLEEAYNQVQEGIFDRIKARASGAKQAIGALGQGVKQKVGQTAMNVGAKMTGQQAPQAPQTSIKQNMSQAYSQGKQSSLTGNFKQKIDTAIQNFNNQFKKVTGKDPTQGLTTISNDAVKLYNAITQLAKNYNPDNTVARETETGQMKNVQKTQQANQQQAGATQQPQQQAGATQPQPANESYSKLEKTLGSEFCKILEESLKRSL